MQKEKKVRAYTRKTKSGKTVSVKAHTAKYDAAEEARKAFAKKAGAGDELVKTKEVVKEKVEDNGLGFTADEYKAWYHWDMVDDPKNPKALKVKKALLASMGPRAYKKYEDQMSESYSSRGDKKAFGALPELVSARTEARNARSFEKLHKGQKALAENLGAKDAAAKFDTMAKEQGAKRKAAEKKLKGDKSKPLSKEEMALSEKYDRKLERLRANEEKAKQQYGKRSEQYKQAVAKRESLQKEWESTDAYKKSKVLSAERKKRLAAVDKGMSSAQEKIYKESLKKKSKDSSGSETPTKSFLRNAMGYSKKEADDSTKKSSAQELSGKKVGAGVAFKDNKAGMAWAKKNGEPVSPYGREGRTYYKVGNDLYGNITGGHGGTIWGKLNSKTATSLLKYSDEAKQRASFKKNPQVPESPAEKTKLYKMLTSKDTKLWRVPDKYRGFFSSYGNPSSQGKAFIKEYEGGKATKKSSEKKKPSGGVARRQGAEDKLREWKKKNGIAERYTPDTDTNPKRRQQYLMKVAGLTKEQAAARSKKIDQRLSSVKNARIERARRVTK